ncbi:50S ribosomal protein L22 [Slackia exigua]|uniref:50S ribosomal protein L22 n=1 Tax=Slackia exigua TaxID=84109 RepID=UPI0028D7B073|nr:50S ribosomal protein L22 [Slackia exigua]
MEARATAKYVRVSPRKARIVVDQVRGKDIQRAREIVAFSERAIAETVGKVIDSAVANAVNNHGMSDKNLFIKAAFVDEGPTMKRFRPRAKGSASPIRKRTSHITVIVAPREEA